MLHLKILVGICSTVLYFSHSFFNDNESAMSVAGFWRRALAFGLDLLFLCGVGFAVGTTFKPFLMHYGSDGRLVGYGITAFYFTICNASLFGGQTIGQMFLNIKVVDKNCQGISLFSSLLRSLIVTLPLWLSVLMNPNDDLIRGAYHWIFLAAILSATSVYLLIFNRSTRQSLHDLVADTYVISCAASEVNRQKVWVGHYMMVALVFVGTIPAAVFAMDVMNELKSQEHELTEVRKILVKEPNIKDAALSVYTNVMKTIDGDVSFTGVKVNIVTDDNDLLEHENVKALAETVRQKCNACKKLDFVNIVLSYGYDIGIWSDYDSYGYLFDEDDFNPKQVNPKLSYLDQL